jgi:hypothetical protein
MKFTILILLSIFIGIGCSDIGTRKSSSNLDRQMNQFVISSDSIPDADTPDRICITIHQGSLWEDGNDATILSNHLLSNMSITVDGVSKTVYHTVILTSNIEYEDGRLVGSWGGPIYACTSTFNLSSGIHNSELKVTNLSGKEFSFKGQFKIP